MFSSIKYYVDIIDIKKLYLEIFYVYFIDIYIKNEHFKIW